MAKRSPEFPLCGNDLPGLRLRRRRLGAAPSRPHAAPAPQGGEARRRSASLHVALALLLGATGVLHAQSRAAQLIDAARAQVSTHHPDSAAALLRVALDSTTQATLPERQDALVWQAIVAFLRGDEALSHSAFRQALVLDSALDVAGLDRLSPDLAEIFRSEKRVAFNRGLVYLAGHVDEPPRRLSAPPLAYPPALLHRHVQGFVEIAGIIDTLGRVEPASLEVLSTPDSGLVEPVKQVMLESRFSPGRMHGLPARVMVQMAVDVRPPRLSAAELVTTARAQVARREADSALATLETALDSVITHPTEGERAFALLVRGVAWSAARGSGGRDSAAGADFAAGLDLYERLSSRGVDLAPSLRRLADSVRLRRPASRRGRAEMAALQAVGVGVGVGGSQLDEQPALVSHPALRYPPEMEALRVGGTVVVEATVDATGHVEPASVRVVTSPNHAFDEEARRVVRGSVYRPGRIGGRPVHAVIRQAVAFLDY